jgi:hypothetical protein
MKRNFLLYFSFFAIGVLAGSMVSRKLVMRCESLSRPIVEVYVDQKERPTRLSTFRVGSDGKRIQDGWEYAWDWDRAPSGNSLVVIQRKFWNRGVDVETGFWNLPITKIGVRDVEIANQQQN